MVAQEGDIGWVMSFTKLPFGFVVPGQAEGKKTKKNGLRKSLVKRMNGSRKMIICGYASNSSTNGLGVGRVSGIFGR